jgi:hypothetical protein
MPLLLLLSVFLCRSFADPGVLNRAEWVKFVAVFFNKEVEAERLFSSIRSDYQKLNSSARAAAGADAKTVAWLTQFGDTITVNFAEYKKQYMEVGEVRCGWFCCGCHGCVGVGVQSRCRGWVLQRVPPCMRAPACMRGVLLLTHCSTVAAVCAMSAHKPLSNRVLFLPSSLDRRSGKLLTCWLRVLSLRRGCTAGPDLIPVILLILFSHALCCLLVAGCWLLCSL